MSMEGPDDKKCQLIFLGIAVTCVSFEDSHQRVKRRKSL